MEKKSHMNIYRQYKQYNSEYVAFALSTGLLLLFVVNFCFNDVGMGGPREADKGKHDCYKNKITTHNFENKYKSQSIYMNEEKS